MSPQQPHRETIQFSLRAFFIVALGIGILAAAAKWLLGLDHSWRLLFALGLGTFVGFVIVFILENVHRTRVMDVLLVALVLFGMWFTGRWMAYTSGLVIGVILATYGVTLLNRLFQWCGVTISRVGDSAAGPQED